MMGAYPAMTPVTEKEAEISKASPAPGFPVPDKADQSRQS
jgi:hypothetical protein